MKKFLLASTLLFLSAILSAQTVFYSESFETPSTFLYTFPNGNGGSSEDFFDRTDLAGAPAQEVYTYNGFDGTYFVAGEDIDGALSTSVGIVYIGNIDISGQTSLQLTASFASGTNIDIDDSQDAIWVEVYIDTGWVEIGRFEADSSTTSSTGFNGQFAEDTDGDGYGDGTPLTGTFTDFTWSIPGTGDSLDVRISMDLQSGDEEAAVDNIRISGISSSGCNSPTTLNASSITTTSATISWTYGSGNTTSNVEWGTTGFTQGSGTLLIDETTGSVSLSSLSAGTDYDFYVQDSCASNPGNVSSWVGPYTFTTLSPEPSNHVTNFAVDSTTYEYLSLTWDDATGTTLPDGYVLVGRDDVSSFATVADGTPVSDDTDFTDGTYAENFSHTGGTQTAVVPDIAQGETYHFEIYAYTNSGTDIDYKTATPPSLSTTIDTLSLDTVVFDGFDNCGATTFTTFDVQGPTDVWNCGSGYYGMNGHGDEDDEDWLISPLLPLANYDSLYIRFETNERFDGPPLELLFSSDYPGSVDPTTANWKSIGITFYDNSTGSSFSGWHDYGFIDIDSLTGTSGYFAFKYTGTASGSNDWQIDNFFVGGRFLSDQTPPAVTNVVADSLTQLSVVFNEPVTSASATNAGNYSGVPGINSATLNTIGDTVTLSISPALTRDDTLIVNNITDLNSNTMTVADTIPFTLPKFPPRLFITELADPANDINARYVEIYNYEDTLVNLSGWKLRRYTNANTSPQSSPLMLTGAIPSKGIYVACNDNTTFTSTYGFAADLDGGGGGPVDSNGDDQIYLEDPNGNVVDFFGRIGEQGGGTDHDFTDGRAERKAFVTSGTVPYNAAEWNRIVGSANAPQDFDPGTWIGAPANVDVLNVSIIDGLTIGVKFNMPIDEVSAETTANYTGVNNLSSATRSASLDSVTLSYGSSFAGIYDTLVINNVEDTSASPDTISEYVHPFIFNPLADSLVINEVMYNSPSVDSLEFVEIYNMNAHAVNLGGLYFEDAFDFTFPTYTIAAGEYAVVALDTTSINDVFSVTHLFQMDNPSAFGNLTNSSENIVLRNTQGTVVDSVTYDDGSPWDSRADGNGYSLVLCDATSDNTDGANWSISTNNIDSITFASPGTANSCPQPIVISLNADSITMCNGDTVPAGASASGGSAPLTYSWSPATGISGNATENPDLFPETTTAYGFTVTDGFSSATDSLYVTVNPVYLDTVAQSICQGDTFSFNGTGYATGGAWYDTLGTAHGCDSVVRIEVSMLRTDTIVFNSEICEGDTLEANGFQFTQAGTYSDTLLNAVGCDSIVVLNLTVNPVYLDTISQSICPSDTFSFNNTNYLTGGTWHDTLNTVNGCDSIFRVDVSLLRSDTMVFNAEICEGDTLKTNGYEFTTAGTYSDTLVNAVGCDSIVVLNLTVSPVYNDTSSTTICDGDTIMLYGQQVYSTGYYSDTLQSAQSCDSVLVTEVTVDPVPVIDSVTVNGISTCGGSDAEIFIHTSGDVSNFEYSIDNGNSYGTDSTFTSLSAGIYDIWVRNAVTGCNVFHGQESISAPGTPSAPTASGAGTYCDSDTINNLAASGSGGTLKWFANSGLTDSVGVGNQFAPFDSIGTITYYVAEDNGVCLGAASSLTVTVNPEYSNLVSQTICEGNVYNFNGNAYDSSGVYHDTLSTVNGCDSVIITSLTVNPVYSDTAAQAICQGDSVMFDGMYRTSTGVYSATYATAQGCDSTETLDLTVHPIDTTMLAQTICHGDTAMVFGNPQTMNDTYYDTLSQTNNGCDSILALTLTVNRTDTTDLNTSICEGDSIQVFGTYRSASGVYFDTLQNALSCDSLIRHTLNVNPTYLDSTSASICNGDSVQLAGGDYASGAGIYHDTLQTANGCDSVIVTTLLVHPVYSDTTSQAICQGDSVMFDGTYRTSSGLYTATYGSVNGCDSLETLDLTVNPVDTTALSQSICQGDSVFLAGAYRSTGGIYTDTLQSGFGCDSLIETTLTVLPVKSGMSSDTICQGDSIMLGGEYRFTAGPYTDTSTSSNGCDSVHTTVLSITPSKFDTVNTSICQGDSIFLDWEYRTTSGTYIDSFTTSQFCDSIVVTHLTVGDTFNLLVSKSICQGDSIFLGGAYRDTSGIFTDTYTTVHGCDSVVTTNLAVSNIITTNTTASICDGDSIMLGGEYRFTNGTYYDTLVTSTGCDSVTATQLAVNSNYMDTVAATICSGDSIMLGGAYQTMPGLYVDSLQSIHTCDSVVYTQLSVDSAKSDSVDAFICQGDSIMLGGTYQTSSGIYVDVYSTANGCDSTVTTDLTVHPSYLDTDTTQICQGDSAMLAGAYRTTPGTYYDSLSTMMGCDSVIATYLQVNPVPVLDSVIATNVSTCGQADGSIEVFASGGSGNYSYSINGGASYSSNSLFTNLPAAGYPVMVDDGSCVSADTLVVLTAPNQPAAPATSGDSAYCLNDSIVPAVASGSNIVWYDAPGLQASDSIGAGSAYQPMALGVGTHTFYATQIVSGCESQSSTVTITVNNLPVVSAGADQQLCGGTAFTLNASGASSYIWSDGTNGATLTDTISASGNYQFAVTGTNVNGCVDSDSVTVSIDTVPSVMFSTSLSFCDGDSATILTGGMPSGGIYSGANVVNDTIYDPVVVGMDTVTYTYVDGNGCSNSTDAVIAVNASPTVSLNAPSQFCENDTVVPLNFGTPAGGTYTARGAVGDTAYVPGNVTTGADTIVYNYTDTLTGCSNSAMQVITINPVPSLNVNTMQTCANDNPSSLVQGLPNGVVFSGTGVVNDTLFAPALSGTGSFNLNYEYTDSTGCTLQSSTTVDVDTVPVIDLGTNTGICDNSTRVIGITANFADYEWNTGATTRTITISSFGTYTLSVTDNNGCEGIDQLTVNQTYPNPTPEINPGDTTICAGDAIALNAGNYQGYNWSNGSAQNSIMVSTAGQYSVTVTDNNQCNGTDNMELTLTTDPVLCGNVGLNSALNNSNVAVYPNPAIDKLTVQITGYSGKVEIQLTDLSGARLQTIKRAVEQSAQVAVDLDGIAAGVYSIQVKHNNGVVTERVVVQ